MLTNYKIEFNSANIVQICAFTLGIITLIWLSYLHLCNHVRYVCFSNNLNILTTINPTSTNTFPLLLSLLLLGLLLEMEKYQIVFFITRTNLNFGSLIDLLLKFNKTASRFLFNALSLYILSISVTPLACIVSLFVFQNWRFSIKKCVPYWLPILLILISNDIHLNPGPSTYLQNNFNFMNWNLNSLTKDNFHRVHLIEAHNSMFNYDLISVCETNLNDTVDLPETLLNDYSFVTANHPLNQKHGGVGLFYKKFSSNYYSP